MTTNYPARLIATLVAYLNDKTPNKPPFRYNGRRFPTRQYHYMIESLLDQGKIIEDNDYWEVVK